VSAASPSRRLAYFSAQAVAEGQDTWAAVMEVIGPMRDAGWEVDLFKPTYGDREHPGVVRRLMEIARAQWRLSRALRSYDALYVRVHPLAWWITVRARRAGVPVVQESNGSWHDAVAAWPSVGWATGLIVRLQVRQYRDADAVIAVSETLAAWLERETGRTDVVVSPNGANDRLFRPGLGRLARLPERYVIFFGQFAPWQRIEVLLAAIERPEWPHGVELVLAGDGALRPVVEEAAARDHRVHYLGTLPYADLPPIVCNAVAATVLTYAPERAGYSPLKLYESMACGVPVICSDTPGQAEYVRAAQAGIVVPPEDPVAVADAAAELAADPERARRMGARGREAVEREYSWAARSRQRREVVERAIGLRPQG
jgi:glycosyltransferase involved in cell wall biosynthesis